MRKPPRSRVTRPPGLPAWLEEQRLAQDPPWTQQDVFDKVAGQFAWKSLNSYANIERGTRTPPYEETVALTALFGKTPDDVPEPPTAEPTPDLASSDRRAYR